MDQERADYDDHTNRRRHPWTMLEKAILFVVVVGSIPVILLTIIVGVAALHVAIYGKAGK
jgi:hypothetical protein